MIASFTQNTKKKSASKANWQIVHYSADRSLWKTECNSPGQRARDVLREFY
jgi:hypothetical protein